MEKKRIIERKLLERGWAVKFDYKRSIIDTIGFTAQMLTFPEERQAFIKEAREVLEEQGLLSRRSRENRKEERAKNKKICSRIEREFLEAGWSLKVNDKSAINDVFFESQCKTLYEEERRDFINFAKKVLEKF
jgi:hypothetical protein